MKSYRGLERIVKGFSNHRRIQILEFVSSNPLVSVQDVSYKLKINYKTGSEHIRRLTQAGLLIKKNQGQAVLHSLSPRGVIILMFLRTLE